MLTIDTFQSGLPIPLFTCCSKLIEYVRMMACGLTVTSWGNPVEGMGDCFHLHCQAGGWDHTGCTGFMDGSHTMIDSEAPPWLVVGDWAIRVHYEVLQFVVFLNEKLDLWLCFACWPFSTALSKVFRQECLIEMLKLVWVPFPLLDLLELCQLAYSAWPIKSCPVPVCIPLCLSWLYGVGCGDFQWHWSMLWPARLSAWFAFVGGLAWTSWSQWMCPWWFPVWFTLPRSAFWIALADLSVPLLWCLVRSQWHWPPHFNTLFNTLCNHNFQDGLTLLALQCCCFHMLSIGQHSVRVDPRYLRWLSFNHSATKSDCWHWFACCCVVTCAPQFLCLVWIDERFGVMTPLGYTIQLLLHCFGCLLGVLWCFVYEPIIYQYENLAGSILVQICQAFDVDIEEDWWELWSLW